MIDYQVGLLNIVRDYSSGDFYRNIIQHATFGKMFNLPVVFTTSIDSGVWHFLGLWSSHPWKGLITSSFFSRS